MTGIAMNSIKYKYYVQEPYKDTYRHAPYYDTFSYSQSDVTSLYYLLKEIDIHWKSASEQLGTLDVSFGIQFIPKKFNDPIEDSCYLYWSYFGTLKQQVSKRIELFLLLDQQKVIRVSNKNQIIDVEEGYTITEYIHVDPDYTRVDELLPAFRRMEDKNKVTTGLFFNRDTGSITYKTYTAKFKSGTKGFEFLNLLLTNEKPSGWSEEDIKLYCNQNIINPANHFKSHKDIYATYRTIRCKLHCNTNEYFPINWVDNHWKYFQ